MPIYIHTYIYICLCMYACALNLYSLKSGSLLIREQFILMVWGLFFLDLVMLYYMYLYRCSILKEMVWVFRKVNEMYYLPHLINYYPCYFWTRGKWRGSRDSNEHLCSSPGEKWQWSALGKE